MASIRQFLRHPGTALRAAGQRYILTVSTLHPHKNFRRLLLAYAEFSRQRPDINLVIAGLRGFDSEQHRAS